MESYSEDQEFEMKNPISRYMQMVGSSLLAGGVVYSIYAGK